MLGNVAHPGETLPGAAGLTYDPPTVVTFFWDWDAPVGSKLLIVDEDELAPFIKDEELVGEELRAHYFRGVRPPQEIVKVTP